MFNQMPRPGIHNREDPGSAPYPQHIAQYTGELTNTSQTNVLNALKQDNIFHVVTIVDTDTIFTHKNGLLSGNNFPNQYASKVQRDPYMAPKQQIQDDPMYREPSQMNRNDWSQIMQQPQLQSSMQTDAVWPDKLNKQMPTEGKASHEKQKIGDTEYLEEYTDGDESQGENDDASTTTTETPKKVRCFRLSC